MERHQTGLMEFGFLNDESWRTQVSLHIAQSEPESFTSSQARTGQQPYERGQGIGPQGLRWSRCQGPPDEGMNLGRAEQVRGRPTRSGDEACLGHLGCRVECAEIRQKAARHAQTAGDAASCSEGL